MSRQMTACSHSLWRPSDRWSNKFQQLRKPRLATRDFDNCRCVPRYSHLVGTGKQDDNGPQAQWIGRPIASYRKASDFNDSQGLFSPWFLDCIASDFWTTYIDSLHCEGHVKDTSLDIFKDKLKIFLFRTVYWMRICGLGELARYNHHHHHHHQWKFIGRSLL